MLLFTQSRGSRTRTLDFQTSLGTITYSSTFVLACDHKCFYCHWSYKNGELMSLSFTILSPGPLVMTTSVHPFNEKEDDPEVLVKVETIDDSAETDDNVDEKASSPWRVTLEKNEDPKSMAAWYKWAIVMTVSSGTLCVTCATSMVGVIRHILPPSDLMRSYL